jgi:hypothetical protein
LFLLEDRGSRFLVPIYQTKEHHIPDDCNVNTKTASKFLLEKTRHRWRDNIKWILDTNVKE